MVTMHCQSVPHKPKIVKPDVPSKTELCPKTLSSKLENLLQELSDNEELEEDELPDLSFRAAATLQSKQNTQTAECVDSQPIELVQEKTTKSVNGETVLPEQDSGYLTAPTISSEEENTSESKCEKGHISLDVGGKMDGDSSLKILLESQNESESTIQHEVSEQCTEGVSDKNDTSVDSDRTLQEDQDNSLSDKQVADSKKADSNKKLSIKSKLAALRISSVKPTIGAGSEFVIDLDADTSTPKPMSAGVSKLMERLMKHSSKKKKRRSKELEMR